MEQKTDLSIVIAIVIGVGVLAFLAFSKPIDYFPTANATAANYSASGLKSFDSWENVSTFLQAARQTYPRYYGAIQELAVPLTAATPAAAKASEAAPDYSTTNVQVAGVDEADILKNDGKYLYTVSSGQIAIVLAYPPASAQVASIINKTNVRYSEVFVKGDKLVAFGEEEFDWEPIVKPLEDAQRPLIETAVRKIVSSVQSAIYPDYNYYPRRASIVHVFDISDRSAPILVKTIQVKGSYLTSRLIGEKVYVIFSEPAYAQLPRPLYYVDGALRSVAPSEISYVDEPFESFGFTTVLGIDLAQLEREESRKIVLTGAGQNIYVSGENAYITYTKFNHYYPVWEAYEEVLLQLLDNATLEKISAIDQSDASEWRKDNLKIAIAVEYLDSLNETQRSTLYSAISEKEQEIRNKTRLQGETTQIHKFSLGEAISYSGKGEVPGHVLNQFSMDEHNGYFRIATTIGEVWRSNNNRQLARNNVYVLDDSLEVVGTLEDLAPGERIYSARFMGEKSYLVTFKKVDPLFVIDLSDPSNPTLLGKLKIPGYSDYLHPFDENHLIGLGKDALPAEAGDFAWYQGVKLAIFDVSNVSAPRELHSMKIGDRGTESYALSDHRAFLFSRERNLLVIPITLAEINRERYTEVKPNTYGEYTFQGAYVLDVTLQDGFKLQGRVSHASEEEIAKSGEYYYGYGTNVQRSAYIGDTLYTVSESKVKANDLSTLEEKASVSLPYSQKLYHVH